MLSCQTVVWHCYLDSRKAGMTDLSTADLRRLAADSYRFEEASFSAGAVVAPRALAFGLLRMFEAYTGEIRLADRFTIVETVAEAHAWLGKVAS